MSQRCHVRTWRLSTQPHIAGWNSALEVVRFLTRDSLPKTHVLPDGEPNRERRAE
ncbi:hypothetical protein V1294_006771 [Bradyrhizobium sp. AZCC 1678]